MRLVCEGFVCFLPPEREDDTAGQSAEHPRSECIRDAVEMLHTHTGRYMHIRAWSHQSTLAYAVSKADVRRDKNEIRAAVKVVVWDICEISVVRLSVIKAELKPAEDRGGDSNTNHSTRGAPVKVEQRMFYTVREGEAEAVR